MRKKDRLIKLSKLLWGWYLHLKSVVVEMVSRNAEGEEGAGEAERRDAEPQTARGAGALGLDGLSAHEPRVLIL